MQGLQSSEYGGILQFADAILRRQIAELCASPSHLCALVRPHLEYGMPACSPNIVADINHLNRIERLASYFSLPAFSFLLF